MRRGRRSLHAALVSLTVACSMWVAPAARAAFPGGNGKIVFLRNEGLYSHIYSMNPDGTAVTQLTFGAVGDRGPTWSPDGKRILFVRIDALGAEYLMAMNANGTGLHRITRPGALAYFGGWSPTGRLVAFGGSGGDCLDVIRVDGTGMRRILCGGISESPSWSPSGAPIAFSYVSPEGGTNHIWTIEPDGSGLTALTFGVVPDGSPDWSPDATHIAFDRSVYPGDAIYVMDAHGANLMNLTANAPTDQNSWPAYSPDGTRIAYGGSQSGTFGSDIFVMDADGSNFVQLTADGASAAPDWQPIP